MTTLSLSTSLPLNLGFVSYVILLLLCLPSASICRYVSNSGSAGLILSLTLSRSIYTSSVPLLLLFPLPLTLLTLTLLVLGLERLSSTLTNSILPGGGDGARIVRGGVAWRMMGVDARGA